MFADVYIHVCHFMHPFLGLLVVWALCVRFGVGVCGRVCSCWGVRESVMLRSLREHPGALLTALQLLLLLHRLVNRTPSSQSC